MPLAALEPMPEVKVAFMNDDHREFARRLADLAEAIDGRVAGRMPVEAVFHGVHALLQHVREHFAREEEAMQKAGFPPHPVHKAEHDRLIGDMESEATHFRETGDAGRLRSYATDTMPAWLVSHIHSMDALAATFIAMRG